ncbi:hypothetical protein EZV62_018334 [Acer yangbiense]|uniref:Uncharacterized protein n=1 Tax=Acer yangbiense TaxID=1000413 RepID=A0A5C7HJ36_9ROSI|nr:hypothetical protein EZV62_018334 [Acer yangbiense]
MEDEDEEMQRSKRKKRGPVCRGLRRRSGLTGCKLSLRCKLNSAALVDFVLSNKSLGDDTFSSEQGFLLRVVSEIVKEQIEEISVPSDFAMGKSGLPTDSIAINVLGYSVSSLRDICAREDPSGFGSDSEDSVDVVDRLISSGLIELFLSLLRDLELPTNIRTAMRLS